MLLLNHQEVPVSKFPSGESHIRLDSVSLPTEPAAVYVLTDKVMAQVEATGELETVLLDGEFFTAPTITEIRNRLQLSL